MLIVDMIRSAFVKGSCEDIDSLHASNDNKVKNIIPLLVNHVKKIVTRTKETGYCMPYNSHIIKHLLILLT